MLKCYADIYRRVVVLFLILCYAVVVRGDDNAIPVVFVEYNCENLFDCRHDTLRNDNEFLPDAERHWNFGRYWRKLNDIGRVIQQCGERLPGDDNALTADYHLPDLVALCEVENDSTMLMLTHASMLRGAGYRYVMTSSEDERGVDVALLYNPLTFRMLSSCSIKVPTLKHQRPTRDILHVKGMVRSGDTLHIYVIHAPSRRGGEVDTEPYRLNVMKQLIQSVDSVRISSPEACMIIAGDFNDYSDDRSLRMLCSHGFVEVSLDALGRSYDQTGVCGTYKYRGEWDSLDHILVSMPLASKPYACHILDNRWMLEDDVRGGYKPFRTYLGSHYHYGVSDHLPLVGRFLFRY